MPPQPSPARNKRNGSTSDSLPAGMLLGALRSLRLGDFTVSVPLGYTGTAGEIARELNDVIDLNRRLASELARLKEQVGKLGRLSQRLTLPDGQGSWKTSVDSVNELIGDLIQPTTEVGRVIGAVASGDLGQKMLLEREGRPLQGEFLRNARVVNGMVEQLGLFSSEVTRVAREVGIEGKLGGQARVKGVAGTWKDLTDNVNLMAGNLTAQVRNIAEVTTAVARGDLSKKITVDVKGEILELKNTINTMVDQLNAFAGEVTRVAREVGTEGKLGGQAQVPGVSGTWTDLTESVNLMASNLTAQVRNIAEVTTAVARGDLSKKITVDVRGEILELKNTINTMVDQLNSFASEVTRVAREVGTEGELGGQAQVPDVAGIWKDLTDGVNYMASNLTTQVRNIAEVTTAVARGDLSKKIAVDVRGEVLALKNTINTMVDQLNSFASEVTRVAREVGTEGRLGGQAKVPGVSGTWKDLTDSVNSMASNLTDQVRNIADVTTAVARGDLSKKIAVDVRGEILALKNTINTMVDQLNSFAGEVTRVAREVGTEGKLGGQAHVSGAAGIWKDLTDNVNSMASNLTNQVRGIARVVTAVANGDLTRKLALEARGEIAELAETINGMTGTLAIFAEQVTSVAREVGVEGRLGGQAKVPGAAGTWRDLTDNVNRLAANLTTQVRAIGDVATAVTKGDLTRYVTVHASGEVAALKDNINEMIRNLKETTQKTTEQDWLKTNLARFTRMLQGQRDLMSVAQQILFELAPLVSAHQGLFYITDRDGDSATYLKLMASYAAPEDAPERFELGQGLVGQCALQKRRITLDHVPAEHLRVRTGLGESAPSSVVILPVLFEGEVNAVIELASLSNLADIHQVFLGQLTESIGVVLNTIAAGMRTEALLQQSQLLTRELQTQQEELRETNERLERQAATLRESEERLKLQQEALRSTNEQLEEKAKLLEMKNQEIEYAKVEIEKTAREVALTSRYKSEFLANMSHELRTPLNSLLILAKMLADNADLNLSPKQVEFARTIQASGTDLLGLINDVLDLSKIESGTIAIEPGEVQLGELRAYAERNFKHVGEEKGLEFRVGIESGVPAVIVTDAKRLQQVLKNLLSNAFKFTDHGSVSMHIELAHRGWSHEQAILNAADAVVALRVSDTGIGIPEHKQRIIFEAFQQGDGTTSRRYHGTGLGLSISREIARLLGGEISVVSQPGAGSSFTLYLPRHYVLVPQPSRSTSSAPSKLPPAPRVEEPVDVEIAPRSRPGALPDDRDALSLEDRALLLIEHQPEAAQALLTAAHAEGFKAVVASDGSSGLALAAKLTPAGIVLDRLLPDFDGWTVLDLLKHAPATRHVPVALLSGPDPRHVGRRLGAALLVDGGIDATAAAGIVAGIERSAEAAPRLLLVDGSKEGLAELFGDWGIDVRRARDVEEALAQHAIEECPCLVLAPDEDGAATAKALAKLRAGGNLPRVLLYLERALSEEESTLFAATEACCPLLFVRSREQLLYAASLYLHQTPDAMSPLQRRALEDLDGSVPGLLGTKVLVVDDDVRNVFAVTSALEHHGAVVTYAEDGLGALALLDEDPEIRAVLMDVMMPDMDGYEVMRRIRAEPRYRDLPVFAVTAKAMLNDRRKCLQAGATDYLAKPVALEHLRALLRVWLPNPQGTDAVAGSAPIHLASVARNPARGA